MTTAILTVLGLLLFSSLNLGVNGYCETNGCSIPGNLPFPYKRFFKSACNKHDICYSCGQRYSWTRLQCDNAFYWDMSKLCSKRRNFQKTCKDFAGIYYRAVRLGGTRHFEVPSKYWCNTCPSSNGDPSVRVNRS